MNCYGCERPASAEDLDELRISGNGMRQTVWRCTDCHGVKRVADWDIDGLSVSCDDCTSKSPCDDCCEVGSEIHRRSIIEADALYGRPYSGWRPDFEGNSVEAILATKETL